MQSNSLLGWDAYSNEDDETEQITVPDRIAALLHVSDFVQWQTGIHDYIVEQSAAETDDYVYIESRYELKLPLVSQQLRSPPHMMQHLTTWVANSKQPDKKMLPLKTVMLIMDIQFHRLLALLINGGASEEVLEAVCYQAPPDVERQMLETVITNKPALNKVLCMLSRFGWVWSRNSAAAPLDSLSKDAIAVRRVLEQQYSCVWESMKYTNQLSKDEKFLLHLYTHIPGIFDLTVPNSRNVAAVAKLQLILDRAPKTNEPICVWRAVGAEWLPVSGIIQHNNRFMSSTLSYSYAVGYRFEGDMSEFDDMVDRPLT